MTVAAVGQSIQQSIPPREQVSGRFSISLPQVAHNLNRVAIPAIMLYAADSVLGAEAGLLGFCVGYVGTTVVGGAMIVVGTVTAPVGGAALVVAGTAAVAAAPYVGAVTGGLTGPA